MIYFSKYNLAVTVYISADRPCNCLASGQSARRIGVGMRLHVIRVKVSKCSRDPPVNLSFPFLSRVSRHLIDFIAIIQLTVSTVASAIAVFRLVNNHA